MHTSVTMLPATSSNPFTICQQKYGVPTASADRHEYLCFLTPIALKASRQAGRHSCPPGDLISHLSCIGGEIPANGKQSYRAIGEPPPLLWLPLVIQMPVYRCHPHQSTVMWGMGGKRKSDGGTTIKTKFPLSFFSPSPFSYPYKFSIWAPSEVLEEMGSQGSIAVFWGGGYPDSCSRAHFCQPLVLSVISPASHQGHLMSKNVKICGEQNKG